MPEKKTKVTLPNGTFDASEVSVKESTERWTDIELEDGTKLRFKPTIISALRVDGQYDGDGNPVYAVKSSNTMVVASAPSHLRKGATVSTKAN